MAGGDVADRVRAYLARSDGAHPRGSDEHFARQALAAALDAYEAGNYGIGAVAVVQRAGELHEYRAGNAMVSGQGLVDHAETRALLRIAARERPDATYPVEGAGVLPSDGICVFGTLEPCPMCACVMTNAGVLRSVSTVEDGRLVHEGEYLVSDGAANVLGAKHRIQPVVWRAIQAQRGLSFVALDSGDDSLTSLSLEIFVQTREEIDRRLAERPPVGQG